MWFFMICVNSILQFNMHLHLCTPIQSMKLDIRFGAHKPLLGFLLPLAYITIIMMSESIFCFCVNCQMLYWPLYDLYFPVMYGNKLFEIELNWMITIIRGCCLLCFFRIWKFEFLANFLKFFGLDLEKKICSSWWILSIFDTNDH